MTDRPKATLRDCIYGLAVGDALGVPYEFRPRGTFERTDMVGYGTHEQPAGTWSDDTSMTLATCDSIRELGRIDIADMRDKFVGWIDRGEYAIDGVFDYGGTTARALRTGKGGSGERDNGNGSLPSWVLHLKDVTEHEIRSGGFVRDTLKAATWCFVNTNSYEDCALAAVNLGDDTDTTAAVAGALAGAAYGMDAIPQEWIDALRGKELIEQCLF